MAEFESLFSKYDRLVLFDTETTGLQYSRDEIIEFAAVVVEQRDGKAQIVQEYDELVTLSPGGFVPPKIQALTGISTLDIQERGLPKTRVCRDIAEMEVELKEGSEEAATRFAQALAEEFSLEPEHKSKHARAMALAGQK